MVKIKNSLINGKKVYFKTIPQAVVNPATGERLNETISRLNQSTGVTVLSESAINDLKQHGMYYVRTLTGLDFGGEVLASTSAYVRVTNADAAFWIQEVYLPTNQYARRICSGGEYDEWQLSDWVLS